MVVKILKRGSAHLTTPTKHVTCRKCKSSLLVHKTDGKTVFDQRDGDYVEIECPVCQDRITIAVSLFK